jgi:hypothetical protein
MVALLAQHSGTSREELVIVDLGCGDFAVASALLKSLTSLKSLKGVRYIGCDIVPELIDYNQFWYGTARYGSTTVEFRKIDIVRDRLPDGEVVRQVLQHLSNAEITAILPKLAAYKYVYVSEHLPVTPEGRPNPDKPTGADIRFDWNSGRGRGVELDLPPWNLTLQEIVRTTSAQKINEVIVTHRVVSFDRKPAS